MTYPAFSKGLRQALGSAPPTLEGLLCALALLGAPARAEETGVFQPPQLVGYKLKIDGMVDFEKDPENTRETFMEIYVNSKGQEILRLETGGYTWAWGVQNTPYDLADSVNNFTIVDTDGDGVFDSRYGRSEIIPFPGYLSY